MFLVIVILKIKAFCEITTEAALAAFVVIEYLLS